VFSSAFPGLPPLFSESTAPERPECICCSAAAKKVGRGQYAGSMTLEFPSLPERCTPPQPVGATIIQNNINKAIRLNIEYPMVLISFTGSLLNGRFGYVRWQIKLGRI
jgi:hypothetical protein